MSHKVFVYGTLKQGEPNYDVLETGRGQGLSDFDATICGHGFWSIGIFISYQNINNLLKVNH